MTLTASWKQQRVCLEIVIHSNLDLAVSDRLHRIRECQPVNCIPLEENSSQMKMSYFNRIHNYFRTIFIADHPAVPSSHHAF